MEWINLLQVLGGILIGGGGVFGIKAAMKKGKAEARHAEHDADKAEVERLLLELDHQQQTVTNLLTLNSNLTERLSKLNATVDKHIDRNRELADRAYKSETVTNRLNEKLLAVTEERDEAVMQAEHYKLWHCERTDCQDPRGGRPPRDKLKNLVYAAPKEANSKGRAAAAAS